MPVPDFLVAIPLALVSQARRVLDLLVWIFSGGRLSIADCMGLSVDADLEVRNLFYFFLIGNAVVTIGFLSIHLVGNFWPWTSFALSFFILMGTCGVLAAIYSAHEVGGAGEETPSGEGGPAPYPKATEYFVIFLGLVQTADVIFLFVLLLNHPFANHRPAFLAQEFWCKISLYLFSSALPFYAIDRHLTEAKSKAILTWKIWIVESVDLMTMVIGVFKINETIDDTWIIPYACCVGANIGLFSILSIYLLARLVRNPEDGTVLDATSLATYKFVSITVMAIDGVTDMPTFIATLVSKQYVGNWGLTMNIVINMLAIARAFFIILYAYLLPKPRNNPAAAALQTPLPEAVSG